jgi:3-isopropylmalate/(R)-2-methylmalate dehydratase small subunit
MALEQIKQVTGRAVVVAGNDIDTDRIIPARFMKCVTFDGLGQYLFHDVRFNEDGSVAKKHNLNDTRFEGASIMISNNNFGCGSSREHAPQALAKAGFKGMIAEGFAEIFFGNSTTLGMPCVTLTAADIASLGSIVEADPTVDVTIDLEAGQVRAGSESFSCHMKPGSREALVGGEWDPIGSLLESADQVAAVADNLGYTHGFSA